jgi:hypothetical protein
MQQLQPPSLLEYFADLEAPRRVERTKEHLLLDIVAIAICAVICGADSWVRVPPECPQVLQILHRRFKYPAHRRLLLIISIPHEEY